MAPPGRAYAKRDDIAKALADFDRAVAVAPAFPFPYLARAHLLFVRDDPKRALADIGEYRRLMPTEPEGAKAEAAIKAAIAREK